MGEPKETKAKVAEGVNLNDLLCVAHSEEKPYEVDNCDQCEFCMTADSGGTIGGPLFGSRGSFKYCEKGFWKEDT